MTLRDCSLFVQVPKELLTSPASEQLPRIKGTSRNQIINNSVHSEQRTRRIRIVITDLDEKCEETRGPYWNSLELELIEGGYYVGNGNLDPNASNCDLSDIWT